MHCLNDYVLYIKEFQGLKKYLKSELSRYK